MATRIIAISSRGIERLGVEGRETRDCDGDGDAKAGVMHGIGVSNYASYLPTVPTYLPTSARACACT